MAVFTLRKSCALLVLALALVTSDYCHAEEDNTAARDAELAKLDKPLEKMRVKELQALLTERGVECRACTEKHDVIERVLETIHLPIKEAEPEAAPVEDKPKDKKDIEDVLKNMKGMPGMENMKVFGKDDIEKLMKDFKKDGKDEL